MRSWKWKESDQPTRLGSVSGRFTYSVNPTSDARIHRSTVEERNLFLWPINRPVDGKHVREGTPLRPFVVPPSVRFNR